MMRKIHDELIIYNNIDFLLCCNNLLEEIKKNRGGRRKEEVHYILPFLICEFPYIIVCNVFISTYYIKNQFGHSFCLLNINLFLS